MLFTLCIIFQELKIINILHNRIEIIETERQKSKSNRIERNMNRYTPTLYGGQIYIINSVDKTKFLYHIGMSLFHIHSTTKAMAEKG